MARMNSQDGLGNCVTIRQIIAEAPSRRCRNEFEYIASVLKLFYEVPNLSEEAKNYDYLNVEIDPSVQALCCLDFRIKYTNFIGEHGYPTSMRTRYGKFDCFEPIIQQFKRRETDYIVIVPDFYKVYKKLGMTPTWFLPATEEVPEDVGFLTAMQYFVISDFRNNWSRKTNDKRKIKKMANILRW